MISTRRVRRVFSEPTQEELKYLAIQDGLIREIQRLGLVRVVAGFCIDPTQERLSKFRTSEGKEPALEVVVKYSDLKYCVEVSCSHDSKYNRKAGSLAGEDQVLNKIEQYLAEIDAGSKI